MIRVYVVKSRTRKFRLYWQDPMTGKRVYKSSKCVRRRDAERLAKELEQSLNTTRYRGDGSVEWESMWERYDDEHLSGLKSTSVVKASGVSTTFREHMRVRLLSDVTPQVLSAYVGKLRKEDYSDQTIASHLRQIKAFLRWTADQGAIAVCPSFPKIRTPKGVRVSHGRPLTEGEFGKLVDEALRAERRDLANFARGIWLSGLRLSEAMVATWGPSEFQIDLDGERPYYRIFGGAEKGNETRLLAMTPDAAEFFRTLRHHAKSDFVFPLQRRRDHREVSRDIIELSRAAEVSVFDSRGRQRPAGCHDLRRSFGERWAGLVPVHILRELMRHASHETTLRYYVVSDAKRTSDAVWKFGASSGATGGSGEQIPNQRP